MQQQATGRCASGCTMMHSMKMFSDHRKNSLALPYHSSLSRRERHTVYTCICTKRQMLLPGTRCCGDEVRRHDTSAFHCVQSHCGQLRNMTSPEHPVIKLNIQTYRPLLPYAIRMSAVVRTHAVPRARVRPASPLAVHADISKKSRLCRLRVYPILPCSFSSCSDRCGAGPRTAVGHVWRDV